MAATVAGRVAFGLGVTPKVSPKWTGFVEGLTWLSCAGMAAAARADLGCRARITAGLAAFMAGRFTLASIWVGFRSGFGSGLGMLIFGASNFTFGTFGGSSTGGGGGGSIGRISSVCSYLC